MSLPRMPVRTLALVLAGFLATAPVLAQDKPIEVAGPYVPTPWKIVDEIMKLANIGPTDFVMDLGSGDGRLVLAAVERYKARGGFGVDIQAELVERANESAKKAGLADRARFAVQDLFATPVSEASVVTLYLLPSSVPKLEGKLLAELAPGSRVVSHDYPFPNWPHDRFVSMDIDEKIPISGTPRTNLYLYTVPARIAGRWQLFLPGMPAGSPPTRLEVDQAASGAHGLLMRGGRHQQLDALKVQGNEVTMFVPPGWPTRQTISLKGKVDGDTMEGDSPLGPWRAVRVPT